MKNILLRFMTWMATFLDLVLAHQGGQS